MKTFVFVLFFLLFILGITIIGNQDMYLKLSSEIKKFLLISVVISIFISAIALGSILNDKREKRHLRGTKYTNQDDTIHIPDSIIKQYRAISDAFRARLFNRFCELAKQAKRDVIDADLLQAIDELELEINRKGLAQTLADVKGKRTRKWNR